LNKLYKLIGNKEFYKMVLLIAVPIMIQNGITNFVSLLDNIMIGQVGTEQMSGVAIVNQLNFVYNLCIFGGVSGAGIFTAQYYGQGNYEGVRQTMRFKLWMVLIITFLTSILFFITGSFLIYSYLKGDGAAESIEATLIYGKQYLAIMLVGLPAFAIVQVYSSTLRECGQTILPMKAGIVAIFVNLILNYILITLYESIGAAIATVLSQLVVDILQYNHIKDEIKIKDLIKVCANYVISALIMFICCFAIKTILNTTEVSEIIRNLSPNKQILNIALIISQVCVGVMSYFAMLVVLKDDYVFKFIDKIKSQIFKRKVS